MYRLGRLLRWHKPPSPFACTVRTTVLKSPSEESARLALHFATEVTKETSRRFHFANVMTLPVQPATVSVLSACTGGFAGLTRGLQNVQNRIRRIPVPVAGRCRTRERHRCGGIRKSEIFARRSPLTSGSGNRFHSRAAAASACEARGYGKPTAPRCLAANATRGFLRSPRLEKSSRWLCGLDVCWDNESHSSWGTDPCVCQKMR